MHRRAVRTLVAALAAVLLAPAAAVAHTITAATVSEDGGALVFQVQGGFPTDSFDPQSGTATEGADFDGEPQIVGVDGEVSVPIADDDVFEGDETVRLVAPDGHEGTGTIQEDDPPPALSVADASVAEGAGPAKLTIAAANASAQDVAIPLAGVDGTAVARADFTVPASVTLPAGATSVEVPVAVADDREDEADETFTVRLGTPANASVADGDGLVTIANDDLRVVDVFEASTPEGDDGTAIARFAIRLDAPTFRTVSVAYTTGDGTARAPGDYLSRLGTATFAPGQTEAFVDVPVVGDDAREANEVFGLGVTAVENARLGDGIALGVIADDDTSRPARADDRPPQMRLAGPRRRRGALTLRVSCPSGERSCAGRATFFTVADRRSRARSLRAERRLGRASFRLRGGRSATLTLSLPRSVLAAARRAGRLKVQAFVVTEDAAGNVDTRTVRATLRYGTRRSR